MPGIETHHDNNELERAYHQAGHHHRRSTRRIAGLLGLLAVGSAMALAALPSRARDEGPGSGATVRLVSHQGGRPEPAMAAGEEPAGRVASRGKSPFSLEAGIEGDTRLGVHGQGPDGVVLQQEQINGILVTRLGPGIPELDQLYTRMMALTNVPGAAFVLCYKGRLVYAAGFGYSNLEDKIPFTPYTPCEIGSVSKPVASMAILRLLDEGVRLPDSSRLAIDSHPYDILGWRAPDGSLPEELRRVTVKHALNHEMLYKHAATREEAAQALGKNINDVVVKDLHIASLKEGLAFEPGSKSQYSGVGQCVMARTTEKLTNTRFDMYLRETTFAPLGIQDAFSFNYYDIASGVLPPSYQWNAQRGEFVREEFPPPAAIGYADAVGSLVMSPLSLARFGDRFLDLYRDPARMSDLIINNRSDKNGGYALGWRAEPLQDGSFALWHGGVIGGWRTGLKVGWNGFTSVAIFNTDSPGILAVCHAVEHGIPDDVLEAAKLPKEQFGADVSDILPRLAKSGRLNRIPNLWLQAGFPN